MRTTVRLDEDIARAVEELRRSGLGTSEAVNRLARLGLSVEPETPQEAFTQDVSAMGRPRMSLDDIGAVLEEIESMASKR